MSNQTTIDFNCNIAIVNPSPTTKDMINDLPDNYTRSQNSDIFTLLYGTGYELDSLKRTLRQLEANNYLYSPDVQSHALKINGSGSYLIQFDVPFVIPPLNVSITGADYSDVYIEYADRFGMVIQVLTDISDVLSWSATGFVGAATDEVLGDALYQNFGALFNFPRQGDSEIDTTFVSKYEATNTFITVETITPENTLLGLQFTQTDDSSVPAYTAAFTNGKLDLTGFPDQQGYNPEGAHNIPFPYSDATLYQAIIQPNIPPVSTTYFQGYIQTTTAVSTPQATHELVDINGNLVALLDASTVGQAITGFYSNAPANYYMNTLPNQLDETGVTNCYVTGFQSTFSFNRWDQLSYQQEVFRADNKYRRLLAGINLSLQEGPSKQGIANIVETLFAQPYIPHETWTQSDFRLFENTPGQSTPKFMTATTTNFATEYDSYPAPEAVVQINGVTNSWNPESITFNNAPKFNTEPIATMPVESLNSATRFDVTSKLITDLRLGFDPNSYPQGGVLNWNYANLSNQPAPGVNTGFSLYEGNSASSIPAMNFIFLNNSADSYAGIKLFYYFAITSGQSVQGNIANYGSYGPLQYNSDYSIVSTSQFLVPGTTNTYNLPSDLLRGYYANANGTAANTPYDPNNPNNPSVLYNFQTPPYLYDAYQPYWAGYDFQQAGKDTFPNLPTFLIQLNLTKANRYRFGVNNFSTQVNLPIYLLNANDFLVYSYAEMGVNSTAVAGNFTVDSKQPQYVDYFDSSTSTSIIQPTGSPFISRNSYSIAQTPFAKFESPTGYPYNLTMLGGQVTFNKTAFTSDLISLPPIVPGVSSFLPQNNYYAINDTDETHSPAVMFHMLATSAISATMFTAALSTIALSGANYTGPFYFQIGDNGFAVQGFLDKNTTFSYVTNPVTERTSSITNQVTQLTYGTYVIRQQGTGAILAIIDDTSPVFGTLNQYWNTYGANAVLVITGAIYHTIWDTRIPISQYAAYPPVFQASSNYGVEISTFTPELDTPGLQTTFNKNFLVIIDGLPGGNQETVTASWSFAIQSLATSTTTKSVSAIGFADTETGPGIMSLYCGRSAYTLTPFVNTESVSAIIAGDSQVVMPGSMFGINVGTTLIIDGSTNLQESIIVLATTDTTFTANFTKSHAAGVSILEYLDLDDATYNQSYTSPYFTGYFLNYKDYIQDLTGAYASTGLTPNGDLGVQDTLTSLGPNLNSVVNFFSPSYGFVSLSILPGMTFSNSIVNTPITVTRPNNYGLKLSMVNPSRSGLVFYGKNGNKIVDKPTRLVVTYTYDAANSATRKKIVQIEDGGYAAWTDALNPNTVNPDDTFFITGNQYKYAHNGFDQPPSQYQYQDSFSAPFDAYNSFDYEAIIIYGNVPLGFDSTKVTTPGYESYDCYPDPSNAYTGVYSTSPTTYFTTFLTDPSFTPNINPSQSSVGPPLRYRRAAPPAILNVNQPGGITYQPYVNPGPQKDSYFHFDLSAFPYDTTITEATLEVYFASGFTIKDGKDVNFALNNNKAWEKSRLSGNGRTQQNTYNNIPIITPLNNVHWRENYYEIIVPYAFLSEPTDVNYGIRNYFGNATGNNIVPGPTNPIENLEYLGFINIDEIDSTQLIPSTTNLVETTVGLANIVLNKKALIYLVTGILKFNYVYDSNGNLVLDPATITPPITNENFYQTVVDITSNNPYTISVIDQASVLPNQKILLFPYGTSSTFFYYGYVKSVLPSNLIGFSPSDINIYQQALQSITPIYSQYTVKLLEADTYFPYTSFGRDTQVSGTTEDISF